MLAPTALLALAVAAGPPGHVPDDMPEATCPPGHVPDDMPEATCPPGQPPRLELLRPAAPAIPSAPGALLLDERLAPEPGGARAGHVAGTPTTLFVNFDGVTLTTCSPSSAADDCSTLGGGRSYAPYHGGVQARAAILQALRELVGERGIIVTGTRPAQPGYTMVVYAGDAATEGVLGLAPSGDCGDQIPGQIAFAYLDGAQRGWIAGGATTVLHEAGHTWGLDHVDAPGTLMYPTGDDVPVTLGDACAGVVADAALTPGGPTCAAAHALYCGAGERQAAAQELLALFGPRVPDTAAPTLELRTPADGVELGAPASFRVEVGVADDRHPQPYAVQAWIEGAATTPVQSFTGALDVLTFEVGQLGPGDWRFHVLVTDLGGNQAALEFLVHVDDARTGASEPGCRVAGPRSDLTDLTWSLPLAWLARRRRPR